MIMKLRKYDPVTGLWKVPQECPGASVYGPRHLYKCRKSTAVATSNVYQV